MIAFFSGKITLDKAYKKQSNLLENVLQFNIRAKPRAKQNKKKKSDTFEIINALYQVKELVFNAFKTGLFPLKLAQGKGIKILRPKQMLQRLSIALGRVKAGSTS